MNDIQGAGGRQTSGIALGISGVVKPTPEKAITPRIAFVLILVLVVPSVYWVFNDHRVWPWDQAWYGEVSTELWFNATHHFGKWMSSMIRAFGTKAPGVALIGQFFVPVGRLLGSVESGLLLSVIACQVGTLFLLLKIGRRLSPALRLVPIAGLLTAAAAPLFVALSHQYVAEPLQLFGVTYFYYLAASAETIPKRSLLGHLLVATSVAMLAKVTSPIYCALPGSVTLVSLVHKFRRKDLPAATRPFWKEPAIVTGVILLTVCIAWYAKNFGLVRDFVRLASSSEVALDYGHRGAFREKFVLWLNASQSSLALPVILICVAILLLVAVATPASRERDQRRSTITRPWFLAVLSALHILGVLCLFSLNINEETRYLLPLLPAVAIVVMWCLSRSRFPVIALGVIVLAAVQWIAVYGQALSFTGRNSKISYWLHPFDADRRNMNEIENLAKATSRPESSGRYNIVGVEHPWLNANSLAFEAAKEQLSTGHRCYYTSLGYAAKDLDPAWDRMAGMNSLYFISLAEASSPEPPNFLNQISIPMLKRVQNSPEFVREPFESGLGIVVFRREASVPVH